MRNTLFIILLLASLRIAAQSIECITIEPPSHLNFTPQQKITAAQIATPVAIQACISANCPLQIVSPDAPSINLIIDSISLANDDYITISNADGQQLAVYSASDIDRRGILQTDIFATGTIIVELHGNASININTVNIGLKGVGDFGASESCEVDAACLPNLYNIAQSTCRLFINGNIYATGVLINNTASDGKPYVLSSAHCFENGELKSLKTRFNYQTDDCSGNEPSAEQYETINGGTLVYYDELRDIALILLDNTPSPNVYPYWAGWTLDTNTDGPFYCIHHPQGDVKKISTSDKQLNYATYSAKTTEGNQFTAYNHWRVSKWSSGSTEGGSSGCGLFNANGLLVGNLSGGSATCDTPENDYFWRFFTNFDALASFLDPLNTGNTSINGAFLLGEPTNPSPIRSIERNNSSPTRYTLTGRKASTNERSFTF